MQATELLARIDARLAELKISARAASIKTGRGPDVIRNIQRAANNGEDYNPRAGTIEDLAYALNVDVVWLLSGKDFPEGSRNQFADRISVYNASDDLPGKVSLSDSPSHTIENMPQFGHSWASFGVKLYTDTFSPVYEPGDTLIAKSPCTPKRGDECLIQFADHTATIRRFVDRANDVWLFHLSGTAKVEEHKEDTFARVSVIVARLLA